MDGFCIDPFHFSDGSMTGYQVVGLTSAPKGSFMSSERRCRSSDSGAAIIRQL